MKFSIATVVAFAALALASPASSTSLGTVEYQEVTQIHTDSVPVPVVKRQNVPAVDAAIPAMADRNGNVIPFDAAKVYQDAAAKGL